MKPSFAGLTDTGVLRSVNQDSYYIDPQGRFFIVADGMGGHAGGEEASRIATKEIKTYLEDRWESEDLSTTLIEKALDRANQGILADQEIHPERRDMGTTVVVVLLRKQETWCAHVGDSRLYLFREQQLQQVTTDHTWVAQALKAGDIAAEQARTHPWRHVLSQCLGRKERQEPDIQNLDLQPRDLLLLCSDGLTEEVSDEEISSYLAKSTDCEEIAQQLIEAAKTAGGADNITAILINLEA